MYFLESESQKNKNLVEAMGIEPMSALHQTPSATCLALAESELPPQRRAWQLSR